MSNRSLVALVLLLLGVFLAVKFDVPTKVKIGVTTLIYGNEMAGIGGFLLQVDVPNPDVASDGLTGESVRRELAAALAKAGVLSLPQELWQKTPGKPSLHLSVQAVKQAEGGYQYTVTIEVDKSEGGSAVPGKENSKTIWSTDKTGNGTVSAIRADINEITHVFLKAHGS